MRGLILYRLNQTPHVKIRELHAFLIDSGVRCSERVMRKEIENIIQGGILITSSNDGYSLTEDTEEGLKKAMAYIDKKIYGLFDRRRPFRKRLSQLRTRGQLMLQL